MILERLQQATLGTDTFLEGPYGKRLVTYADYTASGKSLEFLEDYFIDIGRTYANTHTEQSYTGKITTQLYHDAKEKIKSSLGANDDYVVLPVGTGTTGAIDKLIRILGVYQSNIFVEKLLYQFNHEKHCDCILNYLEKNKPVVFISAYEHHSNEVQWRESYVDVVKIDLTKDGLFNLEDLKEKISLPVYKDRMKIASISAASNVTGILSPVREIAKIVHEHDGYVFFDYAAAGPYVDIQMYVDEHDYFDGIYLSMHKFLGGPCASGLLVMHHSIYKPELPPTIAGGGTVAYVTGQKQRYSADIESREDAGTPGILQVIRSAMALEVKKLVGINRITSIEDQYITRVMERLSSNDSVEILGNTSPKNRLAILSFSIKYMQGYLLNRLAILSFSIKYMQGYLHQGLVAALLNDLFGIQSRAGCACAGPYGIELLHIKEEQLRNFTTVLDQHEMAMKPGWTRVNFHYAMTEATVDYILNAIEYVASYGYLFLEDYHIDAYTGEWHHNNRSLEKHQLSIHDALDYKRKKSKKYNRTKLYDKYQHLALGLANEKLKHVDLKLEKYKSNEHPQIAWFYHQEAIE